MEVVIVTDETRLEAQKLYERGLSAQQVAKQCSISYNDAVSIQAEYVEDLKRQAASHRMLLRHSFRSQLTSALNTLVSIHQATKAGYTKQEITTDHDLKFLKLRIEAAKALVASGQKFIDDDIVNLHTEKPSQQEKGPTLWDFASTVKADGSTMLQIVERKDEPSIQEVVIEPIILDENE